VDVELVGLLYCATCLGANLGRFFRDPEDAIQPTLEQIFPISHTALEISGLVMFSTTYLFGNPYGEYFVFWGRDLQHIGETDSSCPSL